MSLNEKCKGKQLSINLNSGLERDQQTTTADVLLKLLFLDRQRQGDSLSVCLALNDQAGRTVK